MQETTEIQTDWDTRLVQLAAYIATWSKDPSTQVGAVVADDRHRIMGVGYNGFPRGILDTQERLEDRPEKYATTVHAELNAILNSQRTNGMTLYTWPMLPCSECAKAIIQSGIVRVIAPRLPIRLRPRWESNLIFARRMMGEAGLIIRLWEDPNVPGEDKNEGDIKQALDELHAANEQEMQQGGDRGEETEQQPERAD